ncbi:hypothetical protein EYZ11_002030 [Aspergillus tanneri]|uniref:Uncharacterized protein n=1 Tax=Aspergillus tanneri TaxID=1220188 RepID=A0A4S3JRZ6_9EURO|nr:hypothetical protein EYZ11_002030 [Aspergillus tanneri]
MVAPQFPVARKCSGQSTTRPEDEVDKFTTSSSVSDTPPRFYQTVGVAEQPRSPSLEGFEPTSELPDSSLDETRQGALDTLALCRNVITTLELTRLRKSRVGLYNWLTFWTRFYGREMTQSLSSRVSAALCCIDALFRRVSQDLHRLTQNTEEVVMDASSEQAIVYILEQMEAEVDIQRRWRRRKARHILCKMRTDIELIPVRVSDELFDDIKRGVFALDVFCDYHPGDSIAEEHDAAWSEQFVGLSTDVVELSPYLAHQRYQSAAEGWVMPLGSFTANNTSFDSIEQYYASNGNGIENSMKI